MQTIHLIKELLKRAMGQRGREWVERDFASRRVAQLLGETYTWLLGNGPRPDYVVH